MKTLGDAVMFTTDDPGTAVEVALQTIDAHSADDEARPRRLLVDERTAEALGPDGAYVLKRLRKRSVRGYRSITPYLLHRAD